MDDITKQKAKLWNDYSEKANEAKKLHYACKAHKNQDSEEAKEAKSLWKRAAAEATELHRQHDALSPPTPGNPSGAK